MVSGSTPARSIPNGADERAPLLPSSSSSHHSSSRRRSSLGGSTSRRPEYLLKGLLALLFLSFVILLSVLLYYPTQPPAPILDSRGRLNPSHLARGKRGAVAAENGICSKVGLDLLQKGGSAADSAVGTALCVGTLNMFSSGIGGGGFALIRAPTSNGSAQAEHVTIDFRETAPAAAYQEMYEGNPEAAQVGGLAIGVPGELRGLEEIWKRWGKLDWSQVVSPSVRLAQEAKVGRELSRRLKYFGSFIPEKSEWEDIFMDPTTGRFLEVGDTIRRTAYAETLRQVALHGSDVFYEGPIAESMVAKVQKAGGILTLQDLKEYKIEVRNALQGVWIGGRKAWTTPAPTSGSILLQMMNLLRMLGFEKHVDQYHHPRPGQSAPSLSTQIEIESLWSHRLIEAMKHGSASRTRLGDPAFLNVSSLLEISRIPTLAQARHLVSKINDSRTYPLEYYNPLFDIEEDHGTTHLSVVDEDGMAVGITSTVNLIFGSQEMDPHTGVIFNDEMDDTSTPGTPNAFGLRPSPFNYPQPGKRPLSSITPLILENPEGHFELLLGGAGGSRIPSSVLQVLLHLEKGLDLSEAIEEPRWHHQLLPVEATIESTIFDANDSLVQGVRESLKQKGHLVQEMDINFGFAVVQGVQSILDQEGKVLEVRGASDSRKNGWAEAY